VSEGYGYDADRMQLGSQTATKSGGSQYVLMNQTYSFNATAGQMGAGSTAGNAGQLMSIGGTINSTAESAAYTYDNLGRLVTSNQASNGSTVQRRFAYDRWANRTGVWDAVGGGNQIHSITLQQSGGVPTNQIATVTAGLTVAYYYDAAGNLINDGVHTYGYDSENRIVSVDGGSTATYAYDDSNQRYKKVTGGSNTYYIWQDSHVLAEYNSSTGALIAEYIYSGDRLVAKVESEATSYFICDPLGVRLMLDGSGNVAGKQGRLSYGEDFAASGIQEKHHFTTYERDAETGLDYAVNRIYSPNIGRFMQCDPYRGGCINKPQQVNPQKLNRYSYVENDPLNKVDPLGLMSASEFICIIVPILCEDDRLPGGGLPRNPDGYSGWKMGFGDGPKREWLRFRIVQANYKLLGQGFNCVYKLSCLPFERAICGATEVISPRPCMPYAHCYDTFVTTRFSHGFCLGVQVCFQSPGPVPCGDAL
jgi:RHS repeat-associated protein